MLRGKRIRLRPAERSDLPHFVRWFSDPEVTRYLSMRFPMSMAREEQWFEDMLKRPQVEHVLCIEVDQDGEWKLIGNCAFHKVDWINSSAEVGISIGEKEYWNQHYGREALAVLVNYGFTELNLHRIWLQVFANNPRGIRAYESIGFRHEGRKREHEYINGEYVDDLIMGVLRHEWQLPDFLR
ncbi:MAG TPA: GNAT family N-acetyltransferase [Chloroflexi bacterium]|jgi:RimJ/RimL family protein N-acetyltransferase|nr:GNAT family N-acetyltransferase [Chloroflexota bacterium]HPO58087.1 GNAT family protein [Anaerolineaceae bacterium]